MGRRTKDQRRDDYLDVGAALVAESALAGVSDPGLALAHVKLADVADRAGVTKGALYHIWPSQEVFWHDLLLHLMDGNQLFGAAQIAAVATELGGGRDELPTLVDYSNALFDALRDDPAFFARISLFSYLHDEPVRARLDSEFRASVELVAPVLESAISDMGRRLVPGVTIEDFAVSIGALLEGLCLQYRISPDRTPDLPAPDGERRSMFASAAEALLFAYTEPSTVAADISTGNGAVVGGGR